MCFLYIFIQSWVKFSKRLSEKTETPLRPENDWNPESRIIFNLSTKLRPKSSLLIFLLGTHVIYSPEKDAKKT